MKENAEEKIAATTDILQYLTINNIIDCITSIIFAIRFVPAGENLLTAIKYAVLLGTIGHTLLI